MEENLKVDKDYLEAFNLGYELAKELNLKTPMFKDLKSENVRIMAINSGMTQYQLEITQEMNNKNTLDLDKDSGKGFDLSL
ncbi:hypothetical protein [Maribacter sp. 4G9]|uniref:hypothetical protein n=1 Tax=Maribacter sp. 4G9 TaxID=1889777 RepID=UPI000C14AB9F|nr:hypothetical protein [Maribacter sp. 4G9]PIB31429.1 hypothetical protein BFP75_01395 [Maribacter sp. 4G9]